MDRRELTCIGCPMGCALSVLIENGAVVEVSGNTCKKGDEYARAEVTAPVRTVTGSVPVEGLEHVQVSVKTSRDIPKDRIFDVMEVLRSVKAACPVNIGDVLVRDVCGTGADIVATKKIPQ